MSVSRRIPIAGVVAALATSALLLFQQTGAPAPEPAAKADSAQAEQRQAMFVYRVVGGVNDSERLIQVGSDVLEQRDGDDLFVLGNAEEANRLAKAGFSTKVESVMAPAPWAPPKTHNNSEPLGVNDINETYYGGYRTVRAHHSHLDKVLADYPALSSGVTYGQSWRKSTGKPNGYDLRAICLTKKQTGDCALNTSAAKPRFFLMAQIHAREITTGDMAWRWIDHLTQGYGKDAEVTKLMDTTEMWVVPITNPDGVDIVQAGGSSPRLQRKNANTTNGTCGTGGQVGIDLNRNANSHYGQAGTSTNPCAETYRGPRADSETELNSLQALFTKLYPDKRGDGDTTPAAKDTKGLMITFHSYTNGIIFPWAHRANTYTGNDASLRRMAKDMAGITGYTYGTAPQVVGYAASGGTEDWLYDKLGVPGFTFEIGPASGTCGGFLPPYSCQTSTFWPKIKPALMYAAKQAAAPYAS
ncbi:MULTISPECIES: M14 family zinc carboxypeptidase [unclassified Crossiella]|uniref:M14 family zinc carboxypeptidase n=1 Tax=unclassified Crossiella TaxID=2620835 RepID=UPI0020005188|nr:MULTISPECIES: M14 family zinc carboxypeptidase [unclassified Crossiella]MCK2240782.1 carboxypeptidase [Crossiella sp. S99.2]MCK2254074.1 carboxypeptidase [Crossiella sp. S99.1]